MRVVIVDDEAPARSLLRELLAACPGLEVVAECVNGFEAIAAIHACRPDLVFLDVQMPGLDGFEVLELLEHEVSVVFVTAYDEFAVRAFEVGAMDYLLKPFAPERLTAAIERAVARGGRGLGGALAAARDERKPLARILIRDGGKVHVLPVERIDYVEAQGDYLQFRVGEGRWSKQQTLAELEGLLDPQHFVRVHRSYLLNLARLSHFELYAKDSRVAVLRDGSRLPVSRAGYARARSLAGVS